MVSPSSNNRKLRGFLLIEVLVSLAIFIFGMLAILFLILNSAILSNLSLLKLQATLLAQEGLEAARSIRDNNFASLTDGVHGLSLSENKWVFSGISDVHGQLARQVVVSSIDSRTKKIESNINGPKINLTLFTYLTNWKQNSGQAGYLELDLSQATLETGNKVLRDIILKNPGSTPITISKVTVWWDGDSLIQEVKFSDIVWQHNNGSPSGKQPSGTQLDITDFVLGGGEVEDDTWFKFNGPASATDFIVQFIMVDGSNKFVLIDK